MCEFIEKMFIKGEKKKRLFKDAIDEFVFEFKVPYIEALRILEVPEKSRFALLKILEEVK